MSDPAAPDFAGLAAWLRALASPVRLELLRALRYPHALGDIRLAPAPKDEGRTPQRSAPSTKGKTCVTSSAVGVLRIRSWAGWQRRSAAS